MIRPLLCFILVAAACLLPSAPAKAAEGYDNCTGLIDSLPAIISTQGTWCLDKDLSTAMTSGSAISIAANNVILDCNHFKVGGLAAGTATTAIGVRADARLNSTVRNCNIRGFYLAIYFTEGGGHLVEDSSFDGNTFYGIYVSSAGSTVRNNLVIDTGGSTAVTGVAYGIYAANGVDILDNTVNGVAPTGTDASVYGIRTDDNGDGSINGNRVRGLAPTGGGAPLGIYIAESGRSVIRANDVQGPGPDVAGGTGIRCQTVSATARDNVIAGFETGIVDCHDSENIVNTN